jgi:ubiquitin C-terminal hydrolase
LQSKENQYNEGEASVSLSSCIAQFFKEERINTKDNYYKCEKCFKKDTNDNSEAVKRYFLYEVILYFYTRHHA